MHETKSHILKQWFMKCRISISPSKGEDVTPTCTPTQAAPKIAYFLQAYRANDSNAMRLIETVSAVPWRIKMTRKSEVQV